MCAPNHNPECFRFFGYQGMGLTGRNWLAERFEHGDNLTDENQRQYDDDGVGRAIAELHAKKRLRLVAAAVAAIRNVVVVFVKTHREAPVSWVEGITPASYRRLSAESRGDRNQLSVRDSVQNPAQSQLQRRSRIVECHCPFFMSKITGI